MRKVFENKTFMLLLFLAIYSFSISLFDNYSELWLKSNGISTFSISKIITIASIVTALSLFFFSFKVSSKRLKNGMVVALVLKMITSTLLILFNNTGNYFFIKFIMFFDIAFKQIIFSSIYPLMLNLDKSDELFTKREVVESSFDKIGFLFVSYLLGKSFGSFVIDYNKCLLFSVIFLFLSFVILLLVDVKGKNSERVNLKLTFKYFNNNKIIYLFLFMSFFSSLTWSSVVGLKMLTLTETIGLTTKTASYLVLLTGIITNVLAILIVKFLKFKNDYINVFFKYGIRLVFYLLIFIIDSPIILLISFVYLLITDITYNFIFSGYVINNIDEDYTLIYNVVKYCTTLIANGIGTFICGVTFNMSIKYVGLVAFLLGTITYILANVLIMKRLNVKDM